MNQLYSTETFAPREPTSNDYELFVRQHPERGKVAGAKEKGKQTYSRSVAPYTDRVHGAAERKPVDPPPIVQLRIGPACEPDQHYLSSPHFFMCCSLYTEDERPVTTSQSTLLVGTLVSSLHRLKDVDNQDGGFFVFGDLSVKVEGRFVLKFSLFEVRKGGNVVHVKSIFSKPFIVYLSRTFPGMAESTFLSRSFGDQGVRLRIRKEARSLLKRPHPRPDEYPPAPLSNPSDTRPTQSYSQDPSPPSYRTSGQSYPHGSTSESYRSSDQDAESYYGERQAKRQRMSDDIGASYMRGEGLQSSGNQALGQPLPYGQVQPSSNLSVIPTPSLGSGPYSAPAGGVGDYTHRRHYAGSSSNSSLASPIDQLSNRFPNAISSQYPQSAQSLGQHSGLGPRAPFMSDPGSYQQQTQYVQPSPLNPGSSRASLLNSGYPPMARSAQSASMYESAQDLNNSNTMGPPPSTRTQSNFSLSLPPISSSFPLTQTSNTVARGYIERPPQSLPYTLPSQPLGSNDTERYNLPPRQ